MESTPRLGSGFGLYEYALLDENYDARLQVYPIKNPDEWYAMPAPIEINFSENIRLPVGYPQDANLFNANDIRCQLGGLLPLPLVFSYASGGAHSSDPSNPVMVIQLPRAENLLPCKLLDQLRAKDIDLPVELVPMYCLVCNLPRPRMSPNATTTNTFFNIMAHPWVHLDMPVGSERKKNVWTGIFESEGILTNASCPIGNNGLTQASHYFHGTAFSTNICQFSIAENCHVSSGWLLCVDKESKKAIVVYLILNNQFNESVESSGSWIFRECCKNSVENGDLFQMLERLNSQDSHPACKEVAQRIERNIVKKLFC